MELEKNNQEIRQIKEECRRKEQECYKDKQSAELPKRGRCLNDIDEYKTLGALRIVMKAVSSTSRSMFSPAMIMLSKSAAFDMAVFIIITLASSTACFTSITFTAISINIKMRLLLLSSLDKNLSCDIVTGVVLEKANLVEGSITLEKALQIHYSNDLDVDGLDIEPPEASILIDEDSPGEENNYKIDHLSGKQLAANAEIVLRNSGHTKDVDSKSNNIQTTSNIGNDNGTAYPSEMCTNNYYSWVSGDLDLRCSRFPVLNYSHLVNEIVVEMVELFIDDKVVHYLVEQSQPTNAGEVDSRSDTKSIDRIEVPSIANEGNNIHGIRNPLYKDPLNTGGTKSSEPASRFFSYQHAASKNRRPIHARTQANTRQPPSRMENPQGTPVHCDAGSNSRQNSCRSTRLRHVAKVADCVRQKVGGKRTYGTTKAFNYKYEGQGVAAHVSSLEDIRNQLKQLGEDMYRQNKNSDTKYDNGKSAQSFLTLAMFGQMNDVYNMVYSRDAKIGDSSTIKAEAIGEVRVKAFNGFRMDRHYPS
ncbi:hypothetical protein ILUMI_21466 [Ignelater luminosus]|uniref:Uncharacterized protein n=1 Tax=Ignelater luminosus TaxID=2038154 RepID=A0A8K0CIW8_IGNLU|nr:hypothetical protein ILUMI_21466 [Ignelater luminosus]